MCKGIFSKFFFLMICLVQMPLLVASIEPGLNQLQASQLATVHVTYVNDLSTAIIENDGGYVSRLFIDMFTDMYLIFNDNAKCLENSISLCQEVKQNLIAHNHFELEQGFENVAGKSFNVYMQSMRSNYDKRMHSPINLRAATFGLQGKRPSMEDACDIYCEDNARYAFFAVYDGHAGSEVSIFVRDNLRELVLQKLAQLMNPTCEQIKNIMRESFAEVEHAINVQSGSTANVILIDTYEKILYCANLGDSRAVISSQECAIALSRDHKVKNLNERKLLKAAGARIVKDVWYSASGKPIIRSKVSNQTGDKFLAVSRSFGDKAYKYTPALAAAMSEPEITVYQIQPTDQFIIIGCDGLWDFMSCSQATAFVEQALKTFQQDLSRTVCSLVEYAIQKPGQGDNVSAIVVTLH